ncbi:alpha/beta fold hydrolase [Rhodovulum sp. DZ06]|uniref:alpha/beta fold hydrolase n=1 Tax=Rhodovulum sp. DZ06 TaxID=3425126 RepID=UPI003D329681
MTTFVLVHGACHDGDTWAEVAAPLRAAGHHVHTPTMAGNRPGDSKGVGLDDAIASLTGFISDNALSDIVLVGHSWGGMVITGAFDRLQAGTVRRLVYWSAFVPNDGESLIDMVPPFMAEMFGGLRAASEDGGIAFPWPVVREAFMNDMDLETAEAIYAKLQPHPSGTMFDKISLTRPPAAFECGKSYIHCLDDMAQPGSMPWHPRLSEKLGLFRYVSMPGGHEVQFSNPALLAQKIIEAGRD